MVVKDDRFKATRGVLSRLPVPQRQGRYIHSAEGCVTGKLSLIDQGKGGLDKIGFSTPWNSGPPVAKRRATLDDGSRRVGLHAFS